MNELNGKNILVTGANGFIGSWLCKKLVEQNANTTALIHKENTSLKIQGIEEKVTAIKADIRNPEEINKAFKEAKPELCFHLAAVSSIKTAANAMATTFDTNVMATLNMLDAAKQANSATCFASSVKVYGGIKEKCSKEEDELLGHSVYATSKICAENLCKMYAKNFDTNIAIARPGNVFGWGDLKFERLVPGTMKAAIEAKNPQVNGTGESRFDFVFVGDVADALTAIGKTMLKEKMKAETFNIGTSSSTSVKEVVEKIIALNKQNLEIEFSGQEKTVKEKLCIDKAKNRLEWQPKYDLEKGLKETLEWYKKTLK